jgi:NAD(P)H-hydrate epimerase
VQPIVTAEQMRAIDAAATVPVEVLVERAGGAVARAAVRMLGGGYGRTVNVIVGKGNNGADGRVAAAHLARRGVKVRVYEATGAPVALPPADLVIDAAYGTGFRDRWDPPDVGDTPVLAVDVPSGINADTGEVDGPVIRATRTVTFAAWKMGLLAPPGSQLAGAVELADIGLDARRATAWLVEQCDVAQWWPKVAADAHKWNCALRVLAGSGTMTGAAALVAASAQRAGCGMVQVSAPGLRLTNLADEAVQQLLPATGWADAALASMPRFHAAVVGPGLGRDSDTGEQVRRFVGGCSQPVVIDGDGLFALAWNAEGARTLLRGRRAETVLTPHDGEYAMLAGSPPVADRLVAARRLASDLGCVVVLKGPCTVVADQRGQALVVNSGDQRLATAGTGDVLAGLIGRTLAAGLDAVRAGAAGAWVQGAAARRAAVSGMVAGDLALLVGSVVSDLS